MSGVGGQAVAHIECGRLAADLKTGESIAVDGVCLTVVRTGAGWFEADVSPETLRRTSLGGKDKGSALNLERALRWSDRLGGHLVQGHVDGVADLMEVCSEGNGARIRVRPPPALLRFLAEKGSVALDGVSLTIAARSEVDFEVALIPHTLRATTIGEWRVPRRINIEVDLVARYLDSLARSYAGDPKAREEDR